MRVRYYRNAAGRQPVAEYVETLAWPERAILAVLFEEIPSRGLEARGATFRQIEGKLWEIRAGAHRIFYVLLTQSEMVLLTCLSEAIAEGSGPAPKDRAAPIGGGVEMRGNGRAGSEDPLVHFTRLRRELPPEERAGYDERVLAIRTVLELAEHRRKQGLSQQQVAKRMGVSQPVVARLEKPFESSWRQPSLSVLSRYAAALGLTLEVRVRRAA